MRCDSPSLSCFFEYLRFTNAQMVPINADIIAIMIPVYIYMLAMFPDERAPQIVRHVPMTIGNAIVREGPMVSIIGRFADLMGCGGASMATLSV